MKINLKTIILYFFSLSILAACGGGGGGNQADTAPSAPQTKLLKMTNGVDGFEPWITDGTADGTKMLKNINSGVPNANSDPQEFTYSNGKWYFSAKSGSNSNRRTLWVSDGTEAGTKELAKINGPFGSTIRLPFNPSYITAYKGKVYFQAAGNNNIGYELWESDGTITGTKVVKDIRVGSGNSIPKYLTVAGSKLYFVATDVAHGQELWVSDGTTAGTKLVKDINTIGPLAANDSSSPQQLVATASGKLYFSAYNKSTGRELYISDGTAAGTQLIDINAFFNTSTSTGASSNPIPGVNLANGKLLLTAASGGAEPFVSNGNKATTFRLKDINPNGSSNPRDWIAYNNIALFNAVDSTGQFQLYSTDGTQANTKKVANAPEGYGDKVIYNNAVYFSGKDTSTTPENCLYKFDGTTVQKVKGIASGNFGYPQDLFVLNGKLYFNVDDGVNGNELWVSDGTEAGTKLLLDANNTSSGADAFM